MQRLTDLTITSNSADDNTQVGVRVQKSPPVLSVDDLTAGGNTASGNGTTDMRVQ